MTVSSGKITTPHIRLGTTLHIQAKYSQNIAVNIHCHSTDS